MSNPHKHILATLSPSWACFENIKPRLGSCQHIQKWQDIFPYHHSTSPSCHSPSFAWHFCCCPTSFHHLSTWIHWSPSRFCHFLLFPNVCLLFPTILWCILAIFCHHKYGLSLDMMSFEPNILLPNLKAMRDTLLVTSPKKRCWPHCLKVYYSHSNAFCVSLFHLTTTLKNLMTY